MDISAAALNQRLIKGDMPHLLDVREELEYHTFNIGGANIPLSRLAAGVAGLDWDKNDEIIVVCKIGMRSNTGKLILQQMGYTCVKNLTGGLLAIKRLNKQA
jgi:rhodanese-related sulfurtransferase